MNKQQLANKIWESANKMRSKIEANEYKDYILGFIFYKFLSDKEVRFIQSKGATAEEIKNLSEEDTETASTSKAISAISSPTKTCFHLGCQWAKILMFPMCVMHSLRLTV